MNAHTEQSFAVPARFALVTTLACLLLACCSACAVSMAGAQTMNSNMTITNANVTIMSNINGSMQSSSVKEEPKSTIYGRAIYDDTGRPVRRARVILISSDKKVPERSGLTNASGEFRVKNVPAGSYFAAVDAPGTISPISLLDLVALKKDEIGFASVRAQFDEIDVDGKTDKEINVRAKRGAAIGGRVTYADGDAAINVPVTILRRDDESKRLMQVFVGLSRLSFNGMRTDDRGMFRVAGLPPGEYLVAVTEMIAHGEERNSRYEIDIYLASDTLAMTFYPSVTRVKKATPVRVEAGEDRGGVDITIAERGLHTLSGVVRGGRDGRPVQNAAVTFTPKETDATSSGDINNVSLLTNDSPVKAATDEQGRWQFNELPDGIYTISVVPPSKHLDDVMSTMPTTPNTAEASARPVQKKKSYAPKQQDVKIAGSDVADVTTVLAEGGRISGTYTREGTKEEKGSYEYVRFFVETGDGQSLAASGSDNGKFTLDGIPSGKMFLRDGTYRYGGQNEYVKSMTWRGHDLLREPLDIAEDTEIDDVQVVFASDVATLDVRAFAASDKHAAVRGALVLLAPADAAQWSRLDAQQYSCTSNANGACSIRRAPGEYLVVALAPGARQDKLETVIREQAADAMRVTLRANERKSLEVVVPDGGK